PAFRACLVAAARLRRPGSRTFQCARRALFAAGGARQYSDLPALECGAILPSDAAAGAAQVEEAAHRLYAEEHVAASRCTVSARRPDAAEISAGDSRHGSTGRQADSALHRKDRTRTARGTPE